MVVDDDLDTVNLLRLVLQRAGYKVITASSLDEVIDRVKMAEQYHENIDLVILDIMMPAIRLRCLPDASGGPAPHAPSDLLIRQE
jgi:DNA-binding response OmpR family regulator